MVLTINRDISQISPSVANTTRAFDGVFVWGLTTHARNHVNLFNFNLQLNFQGCVPPALIIFTCICLFNSKYTGCMFVAAAFFSQLQRVKVWLGWLSSLLYCNISYSFLPSAVFRAQFQTHSSAAAVLSGLNWRSMPGLLKQRGSSSFICPSLLVCSCLCCAQIFLFSNTLDY